MNLDPFAHPEKFLALLQREWMKDESVLLLDLYPFRVRQTGDDLYVFFTPTNRPIGISTKADADYCAGVLPPELLYAGTWSRAELLREIVVCRISKKNHWLYYGLAGEFLSGNVDTNKLPFNIILPVERLRYEVECLRYELGDEFDFRRRYCPMIPPDCALFAGIRQLRHQMRVEPGEPFFLKTSCHYLFRSIAEDFYDKEQGLDHDLSEDPELKHLICRGRKAELGTCPADFSESPPVQGPVGRKPVDYFQRLHEKNQPDTAILAKIPQGGMAKLTREQVRVIARDPDIPPLVAYACIMAWGGMRMDHFESSVTAGFHDIIGLVIDLRDSSNNRTDDFAMIRREAKRIPGLGISFYTKLLFFLREKPDAYILDQWTAKSARLLFPELGIQLTAQNLPDPGTSPDQYEDYCRALESCCGSRGWGKAWKTGEQVECGLFDKPKGKWRQHVAMHKTASCYDRLDSFIDWLMDMLSSDRRDVEEIPVPEDELDRLSRELAERLKKRRIRIRPGRRRICRILGLYSPHERLVTLYPRMWELVASEERGAPSVAEIGAVVTLHEFAHAVSHVSREEWALRHFSSTPSGIHEIIAERGSWKILPFYEGLLPKSDLPKAHLWLCNDAPVEYRFWKLLEKVGNLGFADALAEWRNSKNVHRNISGSPRMLHYSLDADDRWITLPVEFLRDCGADLQAAAVSDPVLEGEITKLGQAIKSVGNMPHLAAKPAARRSSVDLEQVIEALEACWEPILFGKSAALRKAFSRWRWISENLLQLDQEQLRIRLVEWLVMLHARRRGSRGPGVASILDPDDDDWADLIRDLLGDYDSVV